MKISYGSLHFQVMKSEFEDLENIQEQPRASAIAIANDLRVW